jgi:hypothetical protein
MGERSPDVCSINAAGAANKYMVSTYSLPEQIASPQGGGGVYTCSSENSDGAYAQCDARRESRTPTTEVTSSSGLRSYRYAIRAFVLVAGALSRSRTDTPEGTGF